MNDESFKNFAKHDNYEQSNLNVFEQSVIVKQN